MPKSILIIDDDPKLNRLLTQFLTPYGFRVGSAVTPAE